MWSVRSRDNPKIVIIDNLIIKRVIFAFASQLNKQLEMSRSVPEIRINNSLNVDLNRAVIRPSDALGKT